MHLSKTIRASVRFVGPCFAMMVLAVTIAAFGLSGIRAANQALSRVYRDRVVPMQQLKVVSDDYAVYVIDSVNKANAGLISAEEALRNLRSSRQRIRTTWEAYLQTELTTEEQQLAGDLRALLVPADRALDTLDTHLAAASGSVAGQLLAFDGSLYAVIDPVTAKVTQLVELQLRVAGEEFIAAEARYVRMRRWFIGLLATGVVIGLGATAAVTRSTVRLLEGVRKSTFELVETSTEVAAAAAQVSSTSHSLAEGASEQAASLEETSSSLEELTSMTRRNAEYASEANALAQQALNAADTGSGDMRLMDSAMNEIRASSADISKILKTIDEIAFQTNILALNAAVEAARAGEAGLGFAVVADEVRNLAQRSAQAAHESAARIEEAISKVETGAHLSGKVSVSLNLIVERTRKLATVVADVAAASREQDQGIQQINTAISSMDRVTQSGAASAEEGASAAQMLHTQSHRVSASVTQLLSLIEGKSADSSRAAVPLQRPPVGPRQSTRADRNRELETLEAAPRQPSATHGPFLAHARSRGHTPENRLAASRQERSTAAV